MDRPYHCLDDTPLHELWTAAVGTPGYDKAKWSAVFDLIWSRCPCGMEKRKVVNMAKGNNKAMLKNGEL